MRRTLIAVALFAAACGGTGGEATTTSRVVTTTTEAATTTLGVNVRYESVFDLRERLEAGGFECTEWATRGTNDYALESAECTGQIVLAIYESASLEAEQRELRNSLTLEILGTPAADVVGPNWSVHCGEYIDVCESLQPLVGGELIVAEPSGDGS